MFHKLKRLLFKKFRPRIHKSIQIRSEYDTFLLDSLRHAKVQWRKAVANYDAGIGSDDDLSIQVELTRQRYWYLCRIARLRHVRGKFDINRFK